MNLLTQLGMNDENFQQIRLDGENPLGIPSNHLFSRILLGADIPNTTSTFKKQVKLRSVSDYQALISTLNIAGLEMASVKTICSNVLGLNYDASTYSEDTDTYKKPSLSKGLLHDSTDKAAIADIIRTLINAVVNEHETNKASDTSPHYAQFFLESALAIVDQNIESQQAQRQVTTRARTVSVTELLSGSTAEHTAASQVKEDPATAFETVASSFHSLRDNCEALFPQAQLSDDTSPKRAALFAELQEELKQLFKGEALQANIWDDISKLETRLRQAITRRRASKALLKAAERAHRTFVRLIETTDSNPNALDGDAGYNEKVGRLIKKQLRNARQLRASQRKGESIRLDSLATLASQVTAEQLQSMHPSFFEARDFNGRTLIELIFAQGDTAKIDALCNNLKQVGLYQKCMRTKSPITSLYPMDILILHQPRRAKSTISRLAGERPHVPCHIDRAIRAFKEPSGEQQLDQATVSALVNSRLKASHTIKTYFKLEYLLNDSKLIMRAALNLDSPLGGTHNALITAETDAHMQAFEAQNDAIQAALANVNNGNVTAEGAREAVQQILQAAQHIAQVINDEQLTDDAVHLADGIDGLDIQDSRDRVDELIAHIEQAKQRKKAILMQETVNPVQIAHDADPNTYVLSNEAQAFLEQISELSPQSRMQTAATKMPFIFKLSSTDSYAFKTQVLKFALSRYRRTDDDATKRKFKHLALAFISTFKFDPENTEAESTDRLNALKALIMQELQGEHAANNIELLDLLPALYQALQPSAAVMTESNFYHADASIRNFVTAQLQHTAGLSEEQLSSLSDMSQKLATQLDNAHIGQAAAAAEQLPTSQAFLQDFIAHDNFAFIRQINTFIEARQFHKAKALINVLSSFDHNNADEAFFSQAFKQALNGVLRACLAIPQANNKKELLKTVFKAIGELSNHAEILNGAQGHVIQAEPMDENDVGGHISKDNEDNLIAMLEATKEAGLSEDQQLAALNNLRLASTNGNNYQLLLHQTKHIQLVVVGNEGNNYGPITSIQQAIQQLRSGFEAGRKYVADCRREIANGNDREGIDRPETALLVA